MPPTWSTSSLILIGIAAAAGIAAILIGALRLRETPEKRERRRRLDVNLRGRIIEGIVLDATLDLVHYRYSVSGVDYETAQDVRTLALPDEPVRLLGPVGVKYILQQPSNSIVLCEHWSGLRPKDPSLLLQ